MAATDPRRTTIRDLCVEALRECGWLGQGNAAAAEDIQAAQVRLGWMMQEWERERWLVYRLETVGKVSTGAHEYTIGPGGNFDTGGVNANRPEKLESAFLRMLNTQGDNPVDYPLEIISSAEDYAHITLKYLDSFPEAVWLDPTWPLGTVKCWPVPAANIYAVYLVFKVQFSSTIAGQPLNTVIDLPFEYFSALLYNLAMRLRSYYKITTFPGDELPTLAKHSREVLRDANTKIAEMAMPSELTGTGRYNIFSDRNS